MFDLEIGVFIKLYIERAIDDNLRKQSTKHTPNDNIDHENKQNEI